ncbi:hypothetical protein BJY01DRAFT_133131 [Aspergillus pseudoustus]|uniref:Secreted protein n=1 Tax=Aspergillus pseudoustus TaxID=1810923 RepID=A0ABR4IKP1_9EURO
MTFCLSLSFLSSHSELNARIVTIFFLHLPFSISHLAYPPCFRFEDGSWMAVFLFTYSNKCVILPSESLPLAHIVQENEDESQYKK